MNPLDVLQYGNLTFVKTVQTVPLAEREVPGVCGNWSVKDVIAHLASFEILLMEVLSALLNGSPTPTLDQWLRNPTGFDDQQVLLRRDKSAKEVLTEYVSVFDKVMSFATEIHDEVWGRPGILHWYGGQFSLDDFIIYQYYGHKREHSAEIASFLNHSARRAQAVR